MNGKKLMEELFTMNSERCKAKESVLQLLKTIDWSQYKKYGIEINKQTETDVEFAVYKNHEIQDEKTKEEIKIVTEMKDDDDDWRNRIYVYLESLSSDKVLKKCLDNEYGIYFYDDSQSIRLTISKEGLSQL
jgi:hypothetical protein